MPGMVSPFVNRTAAASGALLASVVLQPCGIGRDMAKVVHYYGGQPAPKAPRQVSLPQITVEILMCICTVWSAFSCIT